MTFIAWIILTASIALAGWGSRDAFLQNFGLVLLGIGLLIGGIGFLRSRLRLRWYAKTYLQARADLEDIDLADRMETTLVVFDVTHARLRQLLTEPGLSDVVDAGAIHRQLIDSGEELYALAKRHRALRLDNDRLERLPAAEVAEGALEKGRAEVERIEEASARINDALQSLQEKVESTRTLVRAAVGSGDAQAQLAAASRELDTGAAAVRELARLTDA
jgi:hypothetical protein